MTTYGIDFRSTSGFVTDPANNTYSLSEAYPTTRGGLTFGWIVSQAGNARDRLNTNDARIAGMVFFTASNAESFRIDLPATGSYDVGCAMGDPSNAQGVQYIEIFDNTTSLVSMQSAAGTSANQFYDLSGVLRTQASFFANQVLSNVTFSTTTMKVKIGKAAVGSSHCLSHLDINQSGGGGSTPVRRLSLLGVG